VEDDVGVGLGPVADAVGVKVSVELAVLVAVWLAVGVWLAVDVSDGVADAVCGGLVWVG
jgi:hypothetical protein